MDKPRQHKKLYKNPDNADLLENSENALLNIAGAMEELAGYEEFADIFDALGDLFDELEEMYERYESIDAMEYREEMDALNRDYLRSVL